VNRGPKCLKTLRFFYKHRDNLRMVLGNHDLHLLAIAAGSKALGRSDTLEPILLADDRNELITWLHQQPLLYQEHGFHPGSRRHPAAVDRRRGGRARARGRSRAAEPGLRGCFSTRCTATNPRLVR
jgi:hypothetical protein